MEKKQNSSFLQDSQETDCTEIYSNEEYKFQFNQSEYGVDPKTPIHLVQFYPKELGIIDRYVDKKLLLNELISPTIISLATD